MNMPNIGDHIIVRYCNGLMPLSLKHTIQTVKSIAENHNCFEEFSTDTTFTSTAVVFTPGLADHSYYTSKWEVVPKIGDRVRALVIHGAPEWNGETCTVSDVRMIGERVEIRGEFQSRAKPDDTLALTFFEWEPADTPEVKPSEEVGIITDLQAQVDRLTMQNSTLTAHIASWERDWSTLTDALHNEADRRGWCIEYDEFVNEIESDLRIGVMPRREREYVVSWTTTVIVNVLMSRTYTAASAEDAEQMAKDDYYTEPDTEDIVTAVRSGDWEESDDPYREYEVEEA